MLQAIIELFSQTAITVLLRAAKAATMNARGHL
jgi:hypothetical protein